jgi:hypothetical protein
MQSEHLQNVRAVWVVAGWLVAISVASLVALAFASFGLLDPEVTTRTGWASLAVVIGFFVGGAFTGIRTVEAPILHGVAMGLTSLVAWFVLNLVVGALLETFTFPLMTAPAAVAYLLLQMVAATLGAWTGYVFALRGGPQAEE